MSVATLGGVGCAFTRMMAKPVISCSLKMPEWGSSRLLIARLVPASLTLGGLVGSIWARTPNDLVEELLLSVAS